MIYITLASAFWVVTLLLRLRATSFMARYYRSFQHRWVVSDERFHGGQHSRRWSDQKLGGLEHLDMVLSHA